MSFVDELPATLKAKIINISGTLQVPNSLLIFLLFPRPMFFYQLVSRQKDLYENKTD